MSTFVRALGIDTGPIPGLVLLRFGYGPTPVAQVVQCDHLSAGLILESLLNLDNLALTHVQVERFVPGRNSNKAGKASAITRDLVGEVASTVLGHNARLYQRSAAEVKPWATDARLDAAGLLDATKGMRHARDAAKHALFVAVKDGGIPDPLSTRRSNR